MTRPGQSGNVWVRKEDTSEIVLRDGAGDEHARFDTSGVVFSDTTYPSDGDCAIKRPVIPEHYGVDPSLEVFAVPEGAERPEDLELIGAKDGEQDLDVPERAITLLQVLQEHGEPVTAREAEEIADLDVSYRTIKNYLDALEAEGAVQSGDYQAREGVEYRPL